MSEDFNPEAQYEMQKAREDEHAWNEMCEAISDGSAGHEDVRSYLASRDVCRPPEMVVSCIEILFDSIKALQTLHREQLIRAERAEAELESPPEELLEKWMQNELHDLGMLVDHLTRTYSHFSDGRISIPNTLPEEVFVVASDLETERWNEWLKEEKEPLESALAAAREEIGRLRTLLEDFFRAHWDVLGGMPQGCVCRTCKLYEKFAALAGGGR